jgi:hypothetical protein
MKSFFVLAVTMAFLLSFLLKEIPIHPAQHYRASISIPVNGNSWYVSSASKDVSPRANYAKLESDTLRTFFSMKEKGNVSIAVIARCETEKANINAIFNGAVTRFKIASSSFDTIGLGTFPINKVGYNFLDLVNINHSEGVQISHIVINGDFDVASANFAKDEFYWGKRGPSVHLTFSSETEVGDTKWFYNEITVPSENDVIGSYFMAIGFAEGYFGIQVNSENERRVLFSVWSPYKTDNPQEIPEDQRIKMLKKGESVTAGKFGGEGSGGQSYLKYMWKAGLTYKFLMKGEPAGDNKTDYTAYFYSPEEDKWMLIASFRRPQTSTYLTRFHSFLENFIPVQGKYARMGVWSNQWVCSKEGEWLETNIAKFTADNTARKGSRLDYAGGVVDGQFFMKNCGFFDETVAIGSQFTRPKSNKKPDIDFDSLP